MVAQEQDWIETLRVLDKSIASGQVMSHVISVEQKREHVLQFQDSACVCFFSGLEYITD